MAYTVLARRYRSRHFDEVVGQEHVARTLKRAIETGRVAHAYLFCGTRGVGKTSMARILAVALNCPTTDGPSAEPCADTDMARAIFKGEDTDVVEIDAASNTGVDNVRDLIDNSRYRPMHGRYKVYIIDEVHMLSKAAFNALLKVMEEPPSHVKFILATTEPEKVLPTILSRCQRYDFRNIPSKEIAQHLRSIVSQEALHADDDALLAVAKAGAGSMRDALSLLDRLLSVGEDRLTAANVEELLGLPRGQVMFDLAESIGEGDVKGVLEGATATIDGGISPDVLVASMADHLRNLLVLRACGRDSDLVEVPGLDLDALVEQAERFDATALSQDIAVLEELRRQMRTGGAGRALLDATLARLAMADQFASISDLAAGGSNGDGSGRATRRSPTAQKKTAELTRPAVRPATPERDDPRVEPASPSPSAASDERPPPAPAAPEHVVPAEPVAAGDVWARVLAEFESRAPTAVHFAAEGRPDLAGLEGPGGGSLVIRYAHALASSAAMLDRPGKKEALVASVAAAVGRPVAVSLVVDNAPPDADAPPPPARPERSAIGRGAAVPAAMRPDDDPGPRDRPADIPFEQFEQDPLVRALMDTLNAKIVKVEREAQAES